jgi:hypothetical protein
VDLISGNRLKYIRMNMALIRFKRSIRTVPGNFGDTDFSLDNGNTHLSEAS